MSPKADRIFPSSTFSWKLKVTRSPPVKSTPNTRSPFMKTATAPAPSRIREKVNANFLIPRKLILQFSNSFIIWRDFFPPTSANHSAPVRLIISAANMLEKIPRHNTVAKPCTGPDPCQKRIAAAITVVTLASKIELNALWKPEPTASSAVR